MTTEQWTAEWDDPIAGKRYGDVFLERATGELPEMESSKAAARRVAPLLSPNDSFLDIGCGGGHYLRSLSNEIQVPFRYVGIDRTDYFIEVARRAHKHTPNVTFEVGDIFNIERTDKSADIVMCNNV